MRLARALVIGWLAASLLSATSAAAQEGTVRGRVTEVATGRPVAAAAVSVLGTVLVAFSDEEGRFLIRGVPAGERRLSVERLGYAPQRVGVEVPGAGVVAVEIALEVRAIAVGEVVSSATKRRMGSFDAPVSVTVQNEAEIRRRMPGTVDEAVAYAPAVQFVGDQINIRGSSGFARGTGTRVLLMMDGVPINSVDAGALNWDIIPLTEVERIEVVKGAGSALYGTSALGGVVNVVTEDAPEEATTRIRLRGGFYDDPPQREWIWSNRTLGFRSVELAHGRRLGSGGIWVRGGLADDDGFVQNGDSDRYNAALRLALGPAENRFRMFGSWSREDHGAAIRWCVRGECEDPFGLAFQPGRVPTSALDDRTRSDKWLAHIAHEVTGATSSSFARASWQRNDWETDFGTSVTGAVSDRFGGEARLGWQPWSPIFFTLGVDGAHSDVDSRLSGQHSLTDLALYLQTEASIGPEITVTLGARGDLRWVDGGGLDETYSEQVSPRLGVVFAPDALTRVRASVGRGFRAPTVAELFTATEVGGFLVIPNPDLRPERSWAGEIGFQRLLLPWLGLDAAVFFYDFDQLIQADTVFTPSTGTIDVTFTNLPESTVQGVEAAARVSFLRDHLQGRVAYTYLDSEDKASGQPLPYRPDHLLTATGSFQLGALQLAADWRYASAFDRVQVFTDRRLDPRVDTRVLDFRLAYRIGRQVLRFGVDNVLNYAHNNVERNLEPIRHYTAALELEF